MLTKLDLDVMAELILSDQTPEPTPVTSANAQWLVSVMIDKDIHNDQLALLLKNDPELFIPSHGHLSGFFIAGVRTGRVTEETSNLVVSKVAKILGVKLE